VAVDIFNQLPADFVKIARIQSLVNLLQLTNRWQPNASTAESV
jgi:hypothetical protein